MSARSGPEGERSRRDWVENIRGDNKKKIRPPGLEGTKMSTKRWEEGKCPRGKLIPSLGKGLAHILHVSDGCGLCC